MISRIQGWHSRWQSCVFLTVALALVGLTTSVTDAELILEYDFEDVAGDTVTDTVGDNDGEMLNGASVEFDADRGSNVLVLDGDDDYVLANTGDTLQTPSVSIAAWVKDDGDSDWGWIAAEGDNVGLYFSSNDTELVMYSYDGAGWPEARSLPTDFRDDEWHLAVGTYDSDEALYSVYMDGELLAEGDQGSDTVYSLNGGDFTVGREIVDDTGRSFMGFIDDLQYYDHALTQEEVTALFEGDSGILGDFNMNGVLDSPDIDDLTIQSALGTNLTTYDLNADSLVNGDDVQVWIKDLFHSWVGDANLDGEFNSGDLVSVLASGTYEIDTDAVWSTGDFNGDGRANTADLVGALADGGYEAGPVPATAAVPEPTAFALLSIALVGWVAFGRTRRPTS